MIETKRGDILQADAEALVNSVNCVGVMGRGIALQFRQAFPDNYRAYRAACARQQLRPGVLLVHDRGPLARPRYIINLPTKRHWRSKSRLADIEAGLAALVLEVRARGIRSVAVPPLGCGLGGLRWKDVRPRIEQAFRDLPGVLVLLYEPGDMPAAPAAREPAPRMTVGRAVLLGLAQRYLLPAMDPFVSLLEVHKLMYFLQEAGEPLRLRFQRGPYGPYAENLRHVLREMEGHCVTGYGAAGDRPDTPIELKPEAVAEAEHVLAAHPETRRRFDRVTRLIEGFETPLGMELLATVHWVATRERAADAAETLAKVYAWNARKRVFTPEQVQIAWDRLHEQGWLEPAVRSAPAAAG